MQMFRRVPAGVLAFGLAVGLATTTASAQVTPAASYTPPDDTPSARIGVTIFTDYTFQSSPDVRDAAGQDVNLNQFQVARAYLNVTGQVHHLLSFRITPDIARETGSGSSLAGSNTFRLKYAYAQVNLGDWLPSGSWVRLGMQQTPYVDYGETVYRYRFQGTIFVDREGFLSSSDNGLSFRTLFPANRGDVHVGLYNGDTYSKAEANDRKAFMVRGTFRPLPMARTLRGLRLTGFYDADAPVKGGERRRAVGDISFEHAWVNAGFVFLDATDRSLPDLPEADARGYSVWATPKTTKGWEGLLRYDRLKPNDANESRKSRTIAGISYWMPIRAATAAFLLDLERVNYRNFEPVRADEQRIALHVLVNF
jgi:hypothetical protein